MFHNGTGYKTMKQITQEEKKEMHRHLKAIEDILNAELHKNHEMQKSIIANMSHR